MTDSFQRLSVSAGSAFVGAAEMATDRVNQPSSTGRKFLKNRMYAMTIDILDTFTKCNPSFRVVDKLPQRVLTNPSEGVANNGEDNEEANLICRVHDQIICSHTCYTILDLLGTGTFGQVFRCQKDGTKEVVAIKIIKNKAAYHSQGLLEIKIARLLNNTFDPRDERHIVRLLDSFEFHNHICLVFELLSMSLLDILTQNQFRGLPLSVVQRFTRQIIAAMVTLEDANIIHCDLKPENILLAPPKLQKRQSPPPTRRKSDEALSSSAEGQRKKEAPGNGVRVAAEDSGLDCASSFTPPPSLILSATAALDPLSKDKGFMDQSPAIVTPEIPSDRGDKDRADKEEAPPASRAAEQQTQGGRLSVWSDVKVIDLGSACFEGRTMYSYIQSRFYRSPEVLLGVPYNGAIDMWSLACVCAEMYLGLPLFPGVSQHNQLTRIIEMMGYPPDSLIEGKNGSKYFSRVNHSSSTSSGSTTHTGASEYSQRDFWSSSPQSPTTQKYHLKTAEEYAHETSTEIPVLRKYLRYSKLDDVIMKCPLANKSRMTPDQKKEEMLRRLCFLNFLEGLFKMSPFERWTAKQAANHPFVTNAIFTGQFVPIVDPKINERKLAYFVQTQQKDVRNRGGAYVQGSNGGGGQDVSADGQHVFRPLQFRRLSEPLKVSAAGVKETRGEEGGAQGPVLQRGQSVREPDNVSSPSQNQMQYQHQSLPYNNSQFMQQQQQYLQRQQISQQQQYQELMQSPPEQYSAYSASTPEGVWASYTMKDPSLTSQYSDAMAQASSQAALTMSRNASSCDDLPLASMMAGKGRGMGGGDSNDGSSWTHNFSDGRDNRGQGFAGSAKQSNHMQQQQQSQQSRSYMQGENGGGLPYPKRSNGNQPRYDHRQNNNNSQNQNHRASPQSYPAPSFLQQQIQSHDQSAHRGQQQQQLQTPAQQRQQQHQYPIQQTQNPSSSQSKFNADNYDPSRMVSGSMDSTPSAFEGFGGSMTDVPLMMTDFGQALMRPELDERRRLHSMQPTGGQGQYGQQYNGDRQQGQMWQNQQRQQSFTRQHTSQQNYYPSQQQQQQQGQQNQHFNQNQNHNRKPPQQRMSTSHEKQDSRILNEIVLREQARMKMQYAASSSDGIGNSSAMSALTNRILAAGGSSKGDDQSDQGRSVSFAVAKSKDSESHNYVAQLVVSNRNSGFTDGLSTPTRIDGGGGTVRSSSDSANGSPSKNAARSARGANTASSSSKPPLAVGDVTDVLADWDPFFSGDDFEMEEDAEESRKGDPVKKVLRPAADSSRSGSTAISDRGSTDDGDIDPDVDESEWRSAGSRGNSADVNPTPELPYRKIA